MKCCDVTIVVNSHVNDYDDDLICDASYVIVAMTSNCSSGWILKQNTDIIERHAL